MGVQSAGEMVISLLLELFAGAIVMTVIVCIITACLQKKSKILRGIRRFFLGITMLVGAFFVLVGVLHAIGVKQDLKDGGRFLFGARDSFFIQLIRLDNQNGPEAHALKPAPFQDDEGDEKAFTLAPGMKLGIDATLGNDVNLDVAPAQKAGIRLTFTNAKFVLRGMELLNPNPREIVAYDKIDYGFLAQDYVSAVRKKKYEGDFCIQLYNSAVITEEMKAKSGNCDIITLAASGTTRLKAGLAALDSAQPSNLEVEYVNLED